MASRKIDRRQALAGLLASGSVLTSGCNSAGPTHPMHTAGIYSLDTSHHPLFDIDYWKGLLGNKVIPGRCCSVQLPTDFFANDALRSKVEMAGVLLGPKRPVDLFFWSTQPARQPWLTRYGGVPFRSKSKPWPEKNGKPATFVAQLCFRDSVDIFSEALPGDLLTVFSTEPPQANGNGEKESEYAIIVQWETIDQISDPLSASDAVPCDYHTTELSGIRHRTYDFLLDSGQERRLQKELAPFSNCIPTSAISLPGTKIAETYFPVQSGWDPRDWVRDELPNEAWQLVGTLYSAELSPNLEWAVLNQKHATGKGFRMGDPGHLVLFSKAPCSARSYFIYG